jgi:hypothetical protein
MPSVKLTVVEIHSVRIYRESMTRHPNGLHHRLPSGLLSIRICSTRESLLSFTIILVVHKPATNLALPRKAVHPQNVRFQNVRFQNVWFQNVLFQNVRFTKRQVSKRLVSKRPVFQFYILIKQKV